ELPGHNGPGIRLPGHTFFPGDDVGVQVQTALLMGLGLLAVGCGSDPPPPPQTPPAAATIPAHVTVPSEEVDDGIRLSGDGVLGSLPDDQIQGPIQQRWSEILRCKEQSRPPWYVSGKIELHFRVSREGEVKRLSIDDGTIGNWGIEKCVLGIARTMHFARPRGGEAEFSYPIEFPARAQVTDWGEEQISADIARHRRELAQCDRAGTRHPYTLFLYLGAGGKVTSAGVAFP